MKIIFVADWLFRLGYRRGYIVRSESIFETTIPTVKVPYRVLKQEVQDFLKEQGHVWRRVGRYYGYFIAFSRAEHAAIFLLAFSGEVVDKPDYKD